MIYHIPTQTFPSALPTILDHNGYRMTPPVPPDAYREAGYVECVPFETPEGFLPVAGTRRATETDGIWREVYDLKSVEIVASELHDAEEARAVADALALDSVAVEKYATFHALCAESIALAMQSGAAEPDALSYETLNDMLDVLCGDPATAALRDWTRMSVRLGNSWAALVVADGGNSADTYARMPIFERRRLMDEAV